MKTLRHNFLSLILAAATTLSFGAFSSLATAATAEDLNRDSSQALQTLYKGNSLADSISKQAKTILVFPDIIKADLGFSAA